ncbi:hypothetical protein K8353_31525 [Burkholderia contaminans]|nr:hypothetical protein [Burkholderia contaminans]
MQDTALTVPSAPSLAVLRCGSCHRATYPSSVYGCSYCGAEPERGSMEYIPACGTLRNFVTIYAPLVNAMPAPFVVGQVDFENGISEEVLIDVENEDELTFGMQLHGVLRNDEQNEHYPLRFVPVAQEAAI